MDWLLEHQRQCWTLLTPGGKVKQANPLETAIMQAIVEHAATIEAGGWRISNAELFPLVKTKLGYDRVSDVEIGKAASRLGLVQCKSGERGRKVTAEQLEAFISTVHTVPTAQTVAIVGNSADANCPATVSKPSAPVQPLVPGENGTLTSPRQIHNGNLVPVTFTTVENLYATLPADVLKNMADRWSEACQGFY